MRDAVSSQYFSVAAWSGACAGPLTYTSCSAREGTATFRITQTWSRSFRLSKEPPRSSRHEDLLARFLVQISTPEIFEPITPELCERWLDELVRAD
jgi:hypothetical protein